MLGQEVGVGDAEGLAERGREFGFENIEDGVALAHVVRGRDECFEFEEGAEIFDGVEVDADVFEHEEITCLEDREPDGKRVSAETGLGLGFGVDREVGEARARFIAAVVKDEFGRFADAFAAFEAARGEAVIGVFLLERADEC